jgi:hypothetical protein
VNSRVYPLSDFGYRLVVTSDARFLETAGVFVVVHDDKSFLGRLVSR